MLTAASQPDLAEAESQSILDVGLLAIAPHTVWPAARRRYEATVAWLPTGRILDLGAGAGWLARAISHSEREVVALDASEKALMVAKDLGTPHLTLATATALPFKDGALDGIATLEMLEHTDDPRLVLAECHRVLRSEGRLVVTVPNGSGLYGLLVDRPMDLIIERPLALRVARRILPSKYLRHRLGIHADHDMRVHHETRFKMSQWDQLFDEAGFRVVDRFPTELVSPLFGVALRLLIPTLHERYVGLMQRVGRLDDWLIEHAPKAMASGWAFLLIPAEAAPAIARA